MLVEKILCVWNAILFINGINFNVGKTESMMRAIDTKIANIKLKNAIVKQVENLGAKSDQ